VWGPHHLNLGCTPQEQELWEGVGMTTWQWALPPMVSWGAMNEATEMRGCVQGVQCGCSGPGGSQGHHHQSIVDVVAEC
jgi:hypothetical protein